MWEGCFWGQLGCARPCAWVNAPVFSHGLSDLSRAGWAELTV